MSWLNLSRGAAILALLSFFMPWFAISCQSTEFLSATGMQLATGTVPPPSIEENRPDPVSAQIWALIAFVLLLGGVVLATAFAAVKYRLRIVCALCGGAALLLAAGMFQAVNHAKEYMGSVRVLGDAASGAASDAASDAAFAAADAAGTALDAAGLGIRIELKFGYWLTLLAATGASAAAYLGATGRAVPQWASAEGLRSVVATGGVDIGGWKPTSFGASSDQKFWDGMSNKSDPDALEEYLIRFPDGQFTGLARTRLLRAGREVPEPTATSPSETPSSAEPNIADQGDGDNVVEKFSTDGKMAAVVGPVSENLERISVCPACRAPVLEDARFCTECGIRLEPGEAL
jgi:hypothetical protein